MLVFSKFQTKIFVGGAAELNLDFFLRLVFLELINIRNGNNCRWWYRLSLDMLLFHFNYPQKFINDIT